MLDRLLEYIAERQLRDGDALPPERKLAEDLGVSRRELRAALASLEASGHVWRGVGRGTYLGARPLKFAPTLRGLRAGASPADIAEMRLLFEPALAELAATKASRDDLLELEKCARKNAAVPLTIMFSPPITPARALRGSISPSARWPQPGHLIWETDPSRFCPVIRSARLIRSPSDSWSNDLPAS